MAESKDIRNERVIRLIESGRTTVEVAAIEGITKQRVHRIWQLFHGGSTVQAKRDNIFTPERINLLGTESDYELAKRWGTSSNLVRLFRKKLGIPKCKLAPRVSQLFPLGSRIPGTLLTPIETVIRKSRTYYICWCQCGNITRPIYPYSLSNKNTKSCGCLRKRMLKSRSYRRDAIAECLKSGPKHYKEIAAALGIPHEYLSVLLSEKRNRSTFVRVGKGMWALASPFGNGQEKHA